MSRDHVSNANVVAWLIPFLLSAMVGIMMWMGSNISDMSRTLAVAVSKIDDHERRIQRIEGKP